MVSGETSLMKGKFDFWAMVAPRAVFPDPGGPCKRMLTKGVRVDDLGLVDHFDSQLVVPAISDLDSFDHVFREVELFSSDAEQRMAIAQLQQAGSRVGSKFGLQIGIKKLLTDIEMARQEPDNMTDRLISAIMGLGM